MDELIAFIEARLAEDERELTTDPPIGLGYANLSVRMFRELAAKQSLLGEHVPDERERGWCSRCRVVRDDEIWVGLPFPCLTLRLVGWSWADHPDYRQEWVP